MSDSKIYETDLGRIETYSTLLLRGNSTRTMMAQAVVSYSARNQSEQSPETFRVRIHSKIS